MPSGSGDRLAWLRSQGLGVACGLATVLLLAVGSVVLSVTRDGASAGIGLDDLRGFFEPPRLVHAWLYLLFAVAALYALNTALATWESVTRRWRSGVRAPSAYAPALFHVGFLLALAAHVVGGFLGAEGGTVVVATGWQRLPGFGEARLVSLDVEALPNGMPRAAWARLEIREPGGRVRDERVGYNAPLSSGAGSRLALLADVGRVWVAHLSSGNASCALAEGQGCLIGSHAIRVLAVAPGAVLVGESRPDVAEQATWLGTEGEMALPGGRPLQLARLAPEPAVALRARAAPGTPWALAAAAALAVGAALHWRKLAR